MCLKTILTSALLLLTLLFCGCDRRWKSLNAAPPDVVTVVRYDQMMEDYLHTDNVSTFLRMNADYPRATRILVEDVLHLGSVADEQMGKKLHHFYNRPTWVRVRKDVAEKFDDFSPYHKKLQEAFAAVHEACPSVELPRVFTFVSAFHQNIIVGDDIVAIGLDKYMGKDYAPYKEFFYPCQRVGFEASRMTQDCLVYFLASKFLPGSDPKADSFLTAMLKWGKVQWVVAKILNRPLLEEATACKDARRWYEKNEAQAWKALSRPDVLSSRDMGMQASLLDFTTEKSYFPDSTSRGVGLWIGMRIIDSYMRNHPDTSWEELLRMDNYESLLAESEYKPA